MIKLNKEYPMNYEEFKEKVIELFLKNAVNDETIKAKQDYLKEKDTEEYLQGLYADTCYDYDNYSKDQFEDSKLLQHAVNELELDY